MSQVPQPRNEPVLTYAPGTPERAELRAALDTLHATTTPLPMRIGGRDHAGAGPEFNVSEPHDHRHVLGTARTATADDVNHAIEAALKASRDWSRTSFAERAAVFLRAADLLAGPWRQRLNAATMLGQSKTAFQAEIDSACELIDFWRWNVYFAEKLAEEQPVSPAGFWNYLELRPLEGFVFAITPFNFTSIAGNLPTAPAIMGNTVVWKPSSTQQLGATIIMQVLEAAGLPPGVINMVTGGGEAVSKAVLAHQALAGIHFTGSTAVFHQLWQGISGNLDNYKSYPRLVGETGGKDFVLAHASAEAAALRTGLIRGAFEYQGQKCSAASRAYVPQSIWNEMKAEIAGEVEQIRMGDIRDFSNFMGAVIDQRAFSRLDEAIAVAHKDPHLKVIAGGETDDSEGWFVRPTIVETDDPRHDLMSRELFGPVLTVYPYADKDWKDVLELVDTTSPYALTGAVFATDRNAIAQASSELRNAAGNFYINDKPTGAVVGQQPFGGARASGTNDKAGSALNLMRWVSARAVKETFVPPNDWRYPHMQGE